MTFRRSKDDAARSAGWRRFVAENRDLFHGAGLPESMCEDRRLFDYFLGDGELDGDLSERAVVRFDGLSVSERTALGDLARRYLEAGFEPGWGLDSRIAACMPDG